MITYREAVLKDVKRIKELSDEGIGLNFYTLEDIKSYIEKENSVIIVGVNEDDMACGFLYSFLAPLEKALFVLGIPKDVRPFCDMDMKKMVGVTKTTSTDRKYRKEGIFLHLMQKSVDYIIDRGMDFIVTSALRNPEGYVVTEGVLNVTGYEPVMELIRPWNHIDSYCPHCKKQFCECDSVVYIRKNKVISKT